MTDSPYQDIFEQFRDQMEGLFSQLDGGEGLSNTLALFEPVGDYAEALGFKPLVAAAGLTGVALLSGVVLAALVTAMIALAAVYFLLTEVFGFELSLTL